MSNFKDMPLDTALQKGDVVTIKGPGEHDVLVREVTAVNVEGRPLVAGAFALNVDMLSLVRREDLTLTRIQRPVPALPTVEGDYILTYADGARQVRTLTDGRWTSGRGLLIAMKADIQGPIESGATLTRVIPADEVKRPEVDVEAATSAFLGEWSTSGGDLRGIFKRFLPRVLEGEFDL